MMNDNIGDISDIRELVQRAVINAGAVERIADKRPCSFRTQPMPNKSEKKTININIEKAGALIVGGNSPVTINMGDETASGTTIGAKDAQEIDSLVRNIAQSRSSRPEQIKKELADHMGIADLILLTKETVGEALTILRGWNERVVREAVNRNGTDA